MSWHHRSLSGLITRFLAIALVIGWSVVPGLCGALLEVEHEHANFAAHDHRGIDGDHHADHDRTVPCCRSLADAKFMAAMPVEAAPPKVIPVAVTLTVERVTDEIAVTSEPIEVATGPPRTRSTRLFSYSPLAPPTRIA